MDFHERRCLNYLPRLRFRRPSSQHHRNACATPPHFRHPAPPRSHSFCGYQTCHGHPLSKGSDWAWLDKVDSALLQFALWAFSEDGLPDLQILAWGDFSHNGRWRACNALLCRDQSLLRKWASTSGPCWTQMCTIGTWLMIT
jgi:hypothetical protein